MKSNVTIHSHVLQITFKGSLTFKHTWNQDSWLHYQPSRQSSNVINPVLDWTAVKVGGDTKLSLIGWGLLWKSFRKTTKSNDSLRIVPEENPFIHLEALSAAKTLHPKKEHANVPNILKRHLKYMTNCTAHSLIRESHLTGSVKLCNDSTQDQSVDLTAVKLSFTHHAD